MKDKIEDLTYMVISKLSNKTGINLTEKDYEEWLEDYNDSFDKAVKKFISNKAYNELDICARLNDYLLWRLELGPDNAGGIYFKK